MNLLAEHRNDPNANDEKLLEGRILDDDHLQQEIERICKREIESFLAPCVSVIRRVARDNRAIQSSMEEVAYKQVLYFLAKTMSHFCRSNYSLEFFRDRSNQQRTYYPAKLYHGPREGRKGEKAGFVGYENRIDWYADTVCLLWEKLKDVRTYDMEMKRAQLLGLIIPGSLLLVDESQDCDGCQIDWMSQQVQHGKQVFLVGDAAQTIYSFRGAKPKFMVALKADSDCTLTTSWRFGPSIAKIANIVLFAKEKSPQSMGYTKTWQPYRVIGGGSSDCYATTESLLPKWKNEKVTLIAFANVTLLTHAVGLLGMKNEESINNGEEGDVPSLARSEPQIATNFPKIHINGRGENSGMKKWKQVTKQIEALFALFEGSLDSTNKNNEMSLPPRQFPEFSNLNVTWQMFTAECQDRELSKYAASIGVIEKFRLKTMQAIELFRGEVMSKSYSAEEAHVILSTCHAAKGMEWSAVQVCDDFLDLIQIDNKGPQVKCQPNAPLGAKRPRNTYTKTTRSSWQFAFKSHGDDVNLLYVACTRARKILSLPQSICTFLSECDLLHDLIASNKNGTKATPIQASDHEMGTIVVFGQKKALTASQACCLYEDICQPLRLENSVPPTQRLVDALIHQSDGEEAKAQDDLMEIATTQESSVASSQDNLMKVAATKESAISMHAMCENAGGVIVLEEVDEKPIAVVINSTECNPNDIQEKPG
jgi:UvrD/REP helicase N-terminal domain